jgi:hypothetical protein
MIRMKLQLSTLTFHGESGIGKRDRSTAGYYCSHQQKIAKPSVTATPLVIVPHQQQIAKPNGPFHK